MVDHGVASRMQVARKETTDATVVAGNPMRFRLASELDRRLWRLQRSPVITWRSPARFGSMNTAAINRSGADVVNLHWITDGFLSIEAIGRIELPIVWSMYDMWPFAGSEHYGTDTPDARWRTGYTPVNRPSAESGFDLDRWTFERKQQHWTTPMHMVPASSWLTDATRSSALMRGWPVTRIPHVVDTELFAPMDRAQARRALGLDEEAPTVVFLASAGIGDARKGWDLLAQALGLLRHPQLQVVVVGPQPDEGERSQAEQQTGARIHWHGVATTSAEVRLLHCAGDVTAVPSREDNLPLTALEAHACGRPIVAFALGGLPDIVESGASGHLAAPFDTADLAAGLQAMLDDAANGAAAGKRARERALAGWSPQAVVPAYLDVYAEAIARWATG